MAERVERSVAQYPFDDLDADIILRSSGGVDFHVYKIILSLASPLFRDMFTLPQDTEASASRDGSIPVVDFTENSQTLDCLLRFCYPITDPEMEELGRVVMVLEAAIKYQMEEAIAITRALLLGYKDDKPREVFSIAARLNLEEEARAAAHKWQSMCPTSSFEQTTEGKIAEWHTIPAGASFIGEMENISTGVLYRLLRFIRTVVAPVRFLEPDSSTTSLPPDDKPVNSIKVKEHTFQYADADIILHSSDGVDFHVHKVILLLASQTLLQDACTEKDGIPVFNIPEDSFTIEKLLQLCYPVNHVDLTDGTIAHSVLQAAVKYDMKKIILLAKWQWMRHMENDPLSVYFISVQHGWEQEAQDSVRRLALSHLPIEEMYSRHMETTSALIYCNLLECYHQCRASMAKISYEYERKFEESCNNKSGFGQWKSERSGVDNFDKRFSTIQLIAAPIVQRELQFASCAEWNRRGYSNRYREMPDIGNLLDESEKMTIKIYQELDKFLFVDEDDISSEKDEYENEDEGVGEDELDELKKEAALNHFNAILSKAQQMAGQTIFS